MALNNLSVKIAYPKNGFDLPVLILIHAWDSLTIDDDVIDRIAQEYSLFIMAVSMRGRSGGGGSRDASGREIYDIYDALNYVRLQYPTRMSDKVSICGWSGGGGNALASACKFPDTFTNVISFFGMSDYGYNATYGWYQQNAYYWSSIAAAVGGAPTDVPNNYHSRYAIEGIINYTGGKLYLFHDTGDTTVTSNHSTRIVDAMTSASMTNYLATITTSSDTIRYQHSIAYNYLQQRAAEAIYIPNIKSQAAWTIPASGSINVMGYIVTKRFTIWLGTGVTAAASCAYDTVAGTYTFNALTTANVAVSVTQGTKTASGTLIPGTPLTLTVA